MSELFYVVMRPFIGLPTIVLLIILLAMALFWAFQLAQLMSLAENQFPARFDKYIWVVLFVLVSLLAAIAFWIWNRQRVAMPVRRLSSRLADPRVEFPSGLNEAATES
jgi:hypothetical protein